jgi:hypothetical protein
MWLWNKNEPQTTVNIEKLWIAANMCGKNIYMTIIGIKSVSNQRINSTPIR